MNRRSRRPFAAALTLALAVFACGSGRGLGLAEATRGLISTFQRLADERVTGPPAYAQIREAFERVQEEWETIRPEVEQDAPKTARYLEARILFVDYAVYAIGRCDACPPEVERPVSAEEVEASFAAVPEEYLREVEAHVPKTAPGYRYAPVPDVEDPGDFAEGVSKTLEELVQASQRL